MTSKSSDLMAWHNWILCSNGTSASFNPCKILTGLTISKGSFRFVNLRQNLASLKRFPLTAWTWYVDLNQGFFAVNSWVTWPVVFQNKGGREIEKIFVHFTFWKKIRLKKKTLSGQPKNSSRVVADGSVKHWCFELSHCSRCSVATSSAITTSSATISASCKWIIICISHKVWK